jgi:hypothetical protein
MLGDGSLSSRVMRTGGGDIVLLRPPTLSWAKVSLPATSPSRTHLQVYQILPVFSLILCAITDLLCLVGVSCAWCYTLDCCLVADTNAKWEVQIWGLGNYIYSCLVFILVVSLLLKNNSRWLLQINCEDFQAPLVWCDIFLDCQSLADNLFTLWCFYLRLCIMFRFYVNRMLQDLELFSKVL